MTCGALGKLHCQMLQKGPMHPKARHKPACPPDRRAPTAGAVQTHHVVRSRAPLGMWLSCSAEMVGIGINPPINV